MASSSESHGTHDLNVSTLPASEVAALLNKWADVLEIPSGDFVNEDLRRAAALISSLVAERDATEALLRQRDAFIVDQGLWTAFVATLPQPAGRAALGEGEQP